MPCRPFLPIVSSCALLLVSCGLAAAQGSHIRVDQFGYRPLAAKVAVLRSAVTGYDAPSPYMPGPQIQIRRSSDATVAWSGAPAAWNGGTVHAQSGDRAWWLDFSALREPGTFYVHDPANAESSETFVIGLEVYRPVLRAAARMYYYQRCGTPKAVPHAGPGWTDAACHLGNLQDLDCRSVLNTAASTSRNLSGGWHDAGDYNKYVNFADDALHDLLAAYETAPEAARDDHGIPESGNGVVDLLDEVRWELQWLLRMQNPDGSVLHKVSVTDFSAASPPSADGGPRRYAPASASATVSACGAFAHAAVVFGGLGATSAFAAQLETAALAAWNWLQANPSQVPSNYNNSGFSSVSAEDDAYTQSMNRLRAAAWLFRRTGQAAFRTWFDANYQQAHLFAWSWASPWESIAQDALLAYLEAPFATPSVVAAIRNAWTNALRGTGHLASAQAATDAYRAHLPSSDHTWGSNRTKSLEGAMLLSMNVLGLDPANAAGYLAAAEGYLHYIHGVNPPGWCFLTNMGALGAGRSVNETYHSWFADGTVWDSAATSLHGPAPGILTGGVNPSFAPDPSYSGPALSPPQGQPILKSYRDWNTSWPQNSWEVTECHIPYQAAYLRLLSPFAGHTPPELGLDVSSSLMPGQGATFTVGGAAAGSGVAILLAFAPGSFPFAAPGWCAELGLQISADPLPHILCLLPVPAAPTLSCIVPVPMGLGGLRVWFQASQSGSCPDPLQSAVIERTLF